jgi:hypothetical protein
MIDRTQLAAGVIESTPLPFTNRSAISRSKQTICSARQSPPFAPVFIAKVLSVLRIRYPVDAGFIERAQ